MARAVVAVWAAALLLLAAGQATEITCASEECAATGQALLQSSSGRLKVPAEKLAGEEVPMKHAVVLEPQQQKDGSWVIPEQLLQRSAARKQRSASGSASLTQAEIDEIEGLHNFYRCVHGVPQMTWDADIADSAEAWAAQGIWEHSPKPRVVNGQNVGENLAWGWPSRTAVDSITAWYDEIIHTDGTPEHCEDSTGENVCHYTQVVWAASVKLGCAKGLATLNISGNVYPDGDYWVCQYGPAGNIDTPAAFAANVLAPTSSHASCSGPTPPPTPAPTPPPTPAPTPAPTAAPTPAPAPPLEEEPDENCHDKGTHEYPHITYVGSSTLLSCQELTGFCGYGFVVAKCPKSCDAC